MKDQHTLIKGYRDLSQAEIDAINMLKKAEADVKYVIDLACKSNFEPDGRHLAIARTHLETGFMFAIKSIAKPTN